ncbi:MAG: UDP-N-acetylmuramate--L-alanine ligase [Thiobacillus sp.]
MNIYFSGIGGVGIGPLAEIALDAGHTVLGSDPADSLMTAQLKSKGVEICKNQDGNFLLEQHNKLKIDRFVYTSALPADHPELVMAKNLGIHSAKRDEMLAYIIRERNLKLIAISGTHGKTTTSAMFVWALMKLDIPVSYSVGTTLPFGPSGKLDKNSEYFVYECDEFDRNFLHFHPYLALLTSIDFDHSDTYSSAQDYLDSFRQFAAQSKQVITWEDQHAEIFEGLSTVQTLSTSDIKDVRLVGQHNRKNATLVDQGLNYLGLKVDINEIMSDFPGVGRRFEKLADNLYSDYGHHPVEIAASLQMAREISDHVVLIYQPHQNIRQHEIIKNNQYTNQFELAEEIYWLPTYLSREDPNLPVLQPEDLIKNITNKDSVHIADFDDKLWEVIQNARKDGKLVVCMGAGKIDGWVRERLTNTTE